MNNLQLQSPNGLAYTFEKLANRKFSWKEENITFSKLNYLITSHLRRILSQTENHLTAPRLQIAMFNLSARITKEFAYLSGGMTLSYELACQALGLYSTKKVLFKIPPELLLNIFSAIPPKNNEGINSHLVDIACVCKDWKELAIIAKREWSAREDIPCNTFGLDRCDQALEYAFKYSLQGLNLSERGYAFNTINFPIKTPKVQSNLKHLNLTNWIYFDSGRLPFPHLVSLNLTFCANLKENNFARILENLPSLEKLILKGCKGITGEKSDQYLENFTYLDVSYSGITTLGKLTNAEILNFEGCKLIPEDILENALLTALKVIKLNLNRCTQISGKSFYRLMKVLVHLKNLSIEEFHISKNKRKALERHPNIECLNLEKCKILKHRRLITLVKSLPKLKNLNLESCEQPEKDLVELLSRFHGLETLNVENWKHNKGNELAKAPQFLHITDLNLSCWQITQKELWPKIMSRFPNLTTLNLAHATISSEETTEILKNHPHLKNLVVESWDKNHEAQIEEWKVSFPHIEISLSTVLKSFPSMENSH